MYCICKEIFSFSTKGFTLPRRAHTRMHLHTELAGLLMQDHLEFFSPKDTLWTDVRAAGRRWSESPCRERPTREPALYETEADELKPRWTVL